MKQLRILPLALVLAIVPAFASTLAFDVYTDQTAWLAAVAGNDIDAFGAGQSLGELSVTTTTGSFGAPQGVFPAGTNVWNDQVTLAGGEVTTFFDGDGDPSIPYFAFGGFWDFSPGGWGQGLTLEVDQTTQVMNICGDVVNGCGGGLVVPDGTFFGIVATSGTFNSMSISADGEPGNAETFDLSQFAMVHTPEPAAFLLAGGALMSLGVLKRFRS